MIKHFQEIDGLSQSRDPWIQQADLKDCFTERFRKWTFPVVQACNLWMHSHHPKQAKLQEPAYSSRLGIHRRSMLHWWIRYTNRHWKCCGWIKSNYHGETFIVRVLHLASKTLRLQNQSSTPHFFFDLVLIYAPSRRVRSVDIESSISNLMDNDDTNLKATQGDVKFLERLLLVWGLRHTFPSGCELTPHQCCKIVQHTGVMFVIVWDKWCFYCFRRRNWCSKFRTSTSCGTCLTNSHHVNSWSYFLTHASLGMILTSSIQFRKSSRPLP